MLTHAHPFRHATSSFREARLCFEIAPKPKESLEGGSLKDADKLFQEKTNKAKFDAQKKLGGVSSEKIDQAINEQDKEKKELDDARKLLNGQNPDGTPLTDADGKPREATGGEKLAAIGAILVALAAVFGRLKGKANGKQEANATPGTMVAQLDKSAETNTFSAFVAPYQPKNGASGPVFAPSSDGTQLQIEYPQGTQVDFKKLPEAYQKNIKPVAGSDRKLILSPIPREFWEEAGMNDRKIVLSTLQNLKTVEQPKPAYNPAADSLKELPPFEIKLTPEEEKVIAGAEGDAYKTIEQAYKEGEEYFNMRERGTMTNLVTTKIQFNEDLSPDEERYRKPYMQPENGIIRFGLRLSGARSAAMESIAMEQETVNTIRAQRDKLRAAKDSLLKIMPRKLDKPASEHVEDVKTHLKTSLTTIKGLRSGIKNPNYGEIDRQLTEAIANLDKAEEAVKVIEDLAADAAGLTGEAMFGKPGKYAAMATALAGMAGGHQAGYAALDGELNESQALEDLKNGVIKLATEIISDLVGGALKKVKAKDLMKVCKKMPPAVRKQLFKVIKPMMRSPAVKKLTEKGIDAGADVAADLVGDQVKAILDGLDDEKDAETATV